MKARFYILLLLLASFITISFNTIYDSYVLDPGHTYIGFDVERFMVGEVSGRFNEFSGNVNIQDKDISTLKVNVKIKTNSLDTNHKTRDGHLKGQIWLYTEKYPEISFISNTVKKNKNNEYMMEGDLTIRGITNTIQFPIEVLGPFTDPTKKETIGIKADIVIDRFNYGIQLNKKMDNGSLFIGKDVKIKIRALAQRE
ncbi:YceI family protein [Aquimarina sp. 2201CG5-10]|uniref:YceI family protein n=1 Tax=Aquimarina callyspongiae TaxID=3098150 RepID=UPI002AB5AD60|nr:YceI family protein [Aquimarina sp. 2201CG5-10]MDY8137100.1 YceI family protein [Aquimarina sp. 2201CG5-10]